MRKILCDAALAVLMAASAVTPAAARALSSADVAAYRTAFDAAEREEWRAAAVHSGRAEDKLLAKVVAWLDYQRDGTAASFSEISRFVDDNPAWPRLHTLRRQAERAIRLQFEDAEILAWFARHSPLTAEGALAYAGALLRDEQEAEANQLIRDTWLNQDFQSAVDEKRFVTLFTDYLSRADHAARLDRLLWERNTAAAGRMLRRVDKSVRALAIARIKLIRMSPGVDAALSHVPADLRDHPGLWLDRMRWRRRKNKDDAAREVLYNAPEDLGRAELWYEERVILVRRALADGHYGEAYRMIADHRLSNGVAFAEGEFLAGWILLTHLRDERTAYGHFLRLYNRVSSPISRARGAYWSGRAARAMGMIAPAQKWLEAAASHPEIYYGQLASEALGRELRLRAASAPQADSGEWKDFHADELVVIVRQLAKLDRSEHATAFLYEMGRRAKTAQERRMAAQLARQVGRHKQAIYIAKRARNEGENLLQFRYPMIDLSASKGADPALLMAMIRQESSFETNAESPAGAHGLMQLMPATAKRVANGLGLRYRKQLLVEDSDYNLRIGSALMGDLLERYDGSHALALAAYNAGPKRVARWMRAFGDPRTAAIDAIDWIESIPFTETRNYVQRVLESMQVYRRLLDRKSRLAHIEYDDD